MTTIHLDASQVPAHLRYCDDYRGRKFCAEVCSQVTIPADWKNWSGSFKDGTVGVAPLNEAALANHPRKAEIKAAYDAEVARLISPHRAEISVLAGYMLIFTPDFVADRVILNLHETITRN